MLTGKILYLLEAIRTALEFLSEGHASFEQTFSDGTKVSAYMTLDGIKIEVTGFRKENNHAERTP